ncbi:right-handed parallel beta-helix repeat-containing protein [Bacillus cereus group sp. N21]|uniref:right-handed parallel beta-helix repeat-containing protein n=1 Tax=Bacillus cereus group sp. N21 TaxID=2794591 RepID=UPI001F5B8CB8|nr:right-handed parallel beta-helix repeat-containing protein [Bacillus cereus group sp. N21]
MKVIYDSDRRSPFDTRTGTDYYNFVGITVSFARAEHAKFVGGEIVGCREDRSFLNPSEVAVEHSYGVAFTKSSMFCTLEDCTVRDFMGDNVTFHSTGLVSYTEFDEGNTIESLDYVTGQPKAVTSQKTLITKMLPIQFDPNKKTDTMFLAGRGYTRNTDLANKFLDVFFYDKNNAFIGVLKRRRVYSDIEIPVGATKYRFQFLDETFVRNHMLTVWFGNIPAHNVVRNCDILNGHRGGITLGGSHNTIEHNRIRGNGKGTAKFLDGKPLFNDPTRYAINMEDSYGSKCVIRDNDIFDSFHGILVGCWDVDIYDNHIHDIDFTAVNLYAVASVKIRGNVFYNNMNNIGLMDSHFYYPYVLVEGNSYTGGTFNLTAAATYRVELKYNKFENMASINIPENCTMSDCHFIYTETVAAAWVLVNKLKNCTFKSSSPAVPQREVTFKTHQVEDCSFENLKVRLEPQNNKVLSKCIVNNSSFKNCEIRNHIFNNMPMYVEITNSKLTDTTVEVGLTNVDGQNSYTLLSNCTVDINSTKRLFTSESNKPYTTYKADKCKITITNALFDAILNSGTVTGVNELILTNNEFIYTGATPLSLKLYTNKNHIRNFINTDNTFTNINLPATN